MPSCEDCFYARFYKQPDPLPELPERGKLATLLFGRPSHSESGLLIYQIQKSRADNEISCKRMPDARTKHKQDWCGEFKNR